MKIAIVYGSPAPIPPIRGIAPGIVIHSTIEHLKVNDDIKVFSLWEPELETIVYDRDRYIAVKTRKILDFILGNFKRLPYRIWHPIYSRIFMTSDIHYINYLLSLAISVRSYKPDLIVSHVNYALIHLLSFFCPKAKIIYYHHGSNIHLRLTYEQWKQFERRLDGLIAVSHAAFQGIKDTFGEINCPHWVIHNGVDVKLFNIEQITLFREQNVRIRYGIRKDEFVIVYSGRIVASKGVHLLIHALKIVLKKYENVKLLVLGAAEKEHSADFEYEKEIHREAAKIPGKVSFLGWRLNQEIPEVLACADLCVLMSQADEGIPLTLLEGMACGLPIIATSRGGIPEIVIHGENGFLLENAAGEIELANAIISLIENPEYLKAMSAFSVSRAKELFTYERVAQDFSRVLALFNPKLN